MSAKYKSAKGGMREKRALANVLKGHPGESVTAVYHQQNRCPEGRCAYPEKGW
jgi:histone acetyltransferase (RNA polymerase elongator complex component)